MTVTIRYGGVPIPKGWQIWGPQSRPEPGRWFFEARYHHTKHWKMGLDYRPMDGAFPAFWMPPTLWKYAAELEQMAHILTYPTAIWAGGVLKVHDDNVTALENYLLEYGEKAKVKKKLLFGTPAGLGAHEHKIPAALENPEEPEFLGKVLMGLDLGVKDSMAVVYGKAGVSGAYVAVEACSFAGQHWIAGDMMYPSEAMITIMGDKIKKVDPIKYTGPFDDIVEQSDT